ncbi:MAG TPA: LemA family protein [Candidatus Bathyarchaeia archaeon]|nr:LemA family protein [Candidatus Bathyarchaeia archaeon]
MNGKLLAVGVILAVVIAVGIFAFLYYGTYNSLVGYEASVDEKWAQVQGALQRRYDLIPRVVNVTRQYLGYEAAILTEITALRSQWAAALQSGNPDTITNATGNMEDGLSRLIVVVESYPELKASEVMVGLISELEGTENRIQTERMRFNEAVRDYNRGIKLFPANLWAGGWGFERREYFQAKVGAEEPPPVPSD